jgi:ribonuclease-3 family protein
VNGLTLAYLGDAYYEFKIRQHLLNKGLTNVNQLHHEAVKFTAGVAQAKLASYLLEHGDLNDEEESLYKRGRNAGGKGRKNIDAKTYQSSTGFEALIGGLFLHQKQRADQIITQCIDLVERGEF